MPPKTRPVLLAIALLCVAASPTTVPTTHPVTRQNPADTAIRDVLKDYTDHIAAKGSAWAQTLFYCTNDDERDLAEGVSDQGAAVALLYLAANDRFGKPGIMAVKTAYQDTFDDDIDAATIDHYGIRATVKYTHGQQPDYLIFENGHWLADTSVYLSHWAPNEDDRPAMLASLKTGADIATSMAKQLMKGQYTTLDQFTTTLNAKLQSN
jgi:hypothetical protein